MHEREIFSRLRNLYAEQREIYARILELSRQQGELVRSGRSLADIRSLLQEKKSCLDIIKRLEMTERQARSAWEKEKGHWSPMNQESLNAILKDVGELIEEILLCEEKNDQEFIKQMRAMS